MAQSGTCPAQVMWSKAHQTAVGGSLFHNGPDHLRRETVSPHSSRFVDGSEYWKRARARRDDQLHMQDRAMIRTEFQAQVSDSQCPIGLAFRDHSAKVIRLGRHLSKNLL